MCLQVLGDPMYGDASANKREGRRASRPLLHAHRVRLAHPTRPEQSLAISAPPPADFATVAAAIAGVDTAELDAWLSARVDAAIAGSADEFDELMLEHM